MIDSEILNKAGIDFNAGLHRFMNDLTLYEAVLTAFVSTDLIERSEAEFKLHDIDSLLKTVHEIKGSSGNAGLTKIYKESTSLVELIRSNSFTDNELSNRYIRFKDVYTTGFAAIKAAIK